MISASLRGYLLLSLATFILGTNGIFARFIDLPSPVLLFYRFLFGTFFLFLFFVLRNRKIPFPKAQRGQILILGILNTLLCFFGFYAFLNTSIANAEILLYAYPIYVMILAPLFLHEKIERSTIGILLASFIGLIFIAMGNKTSVNLNPLGILSGFIAGIIFAVYVIYGKLIRSKYEGIELNAYQMAISFVLFSPFLFILNYKLSIFKMIMLLVMGLLNGAIALSLYFIGIKTVRAQHIGIISYIEPLSAVMFAFLFLSEIPTFMTIIGGMMILGSGYFIMRQQLQK